MIQKFCTRNIVPGKLPVTIGKLDIAKIRLKAEKDKLLSFYASRRTKNTFG